MSTLVLVRHGRSTANAAGILAGRAEGVVLDETGESQAAKAAARLAALDLVGIVSSPLERCQQTAAAISKSQSKRVRVGTDRRFTECGYGEWEGRPLRELAKEPLWKSVQSAPSTVTFPGGESMQAMQDRALKAIERRREVFETHFGKDAVWAVVSHGDVIKSILADALGIELDKFQRIQINPASISVIRYGDMPQVLATNTSDGDLSELITRPTVPQR